MAGKTAGRRTGLFIATTMALAIGGFTINTTNRALTLCIRGGGTGTANTVTVNGDEVIVTLGTTATNAGGIAGTALRTLLNGSSAFTAIASLAGGNGTAALVAVGDFPVATGSNYRPLATLENKSFSINNTRITDTTVDPNNPTEYFESSILGMKTMTISFDGIASRGSPFSILEEVANDKGTAEWAFRVLRPGFGTYEGIFALENLDFSGGTEDMLTFSGSLRNVGAWTYTPI